MLGAFRGVENWKRVTCWRVLFIRSRSVVDVISMRNNWKLRTSQCFLLYLNVDMIKMRKGSLSGAPTPPHAHPYFKGFGAPRASIFHRRSIKIDMEAYIDFITRPSFL